MVSINTKLAPMQQISKDVNDMKESLEFMSVKYEELLMKVEKMEKENREKSTKVEELTQKVNQKEKVIEDLLLRVREVEQYSRNKNIEISGVESMQDENLLTVMEKIAQKIGVSYTEGDIDVIHRVPTRRGEGPPKIIAQFTNRKIRNQWLKNKKNAPILSDDITTGNSKTRVYMNTHLTFEWKQLLWRAKQEGKPKGYHVIWYQDSKIIAKKNYADDRPVIIKSEVDLVKLV